LEIKGDKKMTIKEYVDSLRQIADFYEANPECPLPGGTIFYIDAVHGKEEMSNVARIFGSCEKSVDTSFYNLIKVFGSLKLWAREWREKICTRKVIGVQFVPEKYIPGTLIEAHEEEIVEWDCPESLLDEEVTTEETK
jgi:hypothetical protein